MAKKAKQMRKDWTVRIRCVVEKEIFCQDCTEHEARHDPWSYAHDEREIDQIDWTVLAVVENI